MFAVETFLDMLAKWFLWTFGQIKAFDYRQLNWFELNQQIFQYSSTVKFLIHNQINFKASSISPAYSQEPLKFLN